MAHGLRHAAAAHLAGQPAGVAGAATSIAINSAFFIPRKTGILAHIVLFGVFLGANLGAPPFLRATGAPRTALESCSLPRRRRVSRKMVGRLPTHATPRRDDAAARAQMIEIACGVHLQIIDASSSYDNSRRQGRLIGRGARVRRKLGAT